MMLFNAGAVCSTAATPARFFAAQSDGLGAVTPDSSFNTAGLCFLYGWWFGGEVTLSCPNQMQG
jgi:hypothetical protein